MSKRAQELAAECTMAVVQAVRNGKDVQAAALGILEQYGRECLEAAANAINIKWQPEGCEVTRAADIATASAMKAIREMELP